MALNRKYFSLLFILLFSLVLTGCNTFSKEDISDNQEVIKPAPSLSSEQKVNATISGEDMIYHAKEKKDDLLLKQEELEASVFVDETINKESFTTLEKDYYFEAKITELNEFYLIGKPVAGFGEVSNFETVYIIADEDFNVKNYNVGDSVAVIYNKILRNNVPVRILPEKIIAIKETLPRMVFLNGQLYKDTGKISISTEFIDIEKIDSTVNNLETPSQHGQSNFGSGFSYINRGNGLVEVKIGGSWIYFTSDKFKGEVPSIESTRPVPSKPVINESYTSIKDEFLPADDFGFYGEVLSVNNNSILVKLNRNLDNSKTRNSFSYTFDFVVDKYVNNKWNRLEDKSHLFEPDFDYHSVSIDSSGTRYDWSRIYGTLTSGKYRLGVIFKVEEYGEVMLFLEFNI